MLFFIIHETIDKVNRNNHLGRQYKRKIFELNGSVKIIQGKIAAGEPWPGEHIRKLSESCYTALRGTTWILN